jgi:hypothetical protein
VCLDIETWGAVGFMVNATVQAPAFFEPVDAQVLIPPIGMGGRGVE